MLKLELHSRNYHYQSVLSPTKQYSQNIFICRLTILEALDKFFFQYFGDFLQDDNNKF